MYPGLLKLSKKESFVVIINDFYSSNIIANFLMMKKAVFNSFCKTFAQHLFQVKRLP